MQKKEQTSPSQLVVGDDESGQGSRRPLSSIRSWDPLHPKDPSDKPGYEPPCRDQYR